MQIAKLLRDSQHERDREQREWQQKQSNRAILFSMLGVVVGAVLKTILDLVR